MKLLSHLGRLVLSATLMTHSSLFGAELRIWTSSTGTTIEAKFQKMDDGEVHLVTPQSKIIKVKLKGLSLADRQHLVEYAEADPKILTEIALTVPEKAARIDKSTFKSHKEKTMGFGDLTNIEFDLFETEHFYVASLGRFRPNATAEIAERLWHGMAFQHMNFRQDWGDKKMVIIITNDDEGYAALGKWYADWIVKNYPEEEKGLQAANRLNSIWMKIAGTSINLPEKQQEEFNAFPIAKVFRIREGDVDGYKKVFSPFATHGLADMLLSHQMGGVSSISPDGYFALTTGHGYFKEIQLADKSETSLLNADDYGEENEITSARGFSDGRSWAKTLRKLVRKGDVTPNVEKLLSYNAQDLTPEQLVLIYSFSYYMQSSSKRLTSYANMVRRIESNSQVPAPIEIARIFGFETVEAFQADWTEFIKSTQFK